MYPTPMPACKRAGIFFAIVGRLTTGVRKIVECSHSHTFKKHIRLLLIGSQILRFTQKDKTGSFVLEFVMLNEVKHLKTGRVKALKM